LLSKPKTLDSPPRRLSRVFAEFAVRLATGRRKRHSYAVRVLEAMEAMPGLERPTEIA
jgi:hypothetical protein